MDAPTWQRIYALSNGPSRSDLAGRWLPFRGRPEHLCVCGDAGRMLSTPCRFALQSNGAFASSLPRSWHPLKESNRRLPDSNPGTSAESLSLDDRSVDLCVPKDGFQKASACFEPPCQAIRFRPLTDRKPLFAGKTCLCPRLFVPRLYVERRSDWTTVPQAASDWSPLSRIRKWHASRKQGPDLSHTETPYACSA